MARLLPMEELPKRKCRIQVRAPHVLRERVNNVFLNTSTWTVHCNHEFHGIDLEYTCSALEWNTIAQKARQMSIMHHVDIKKLVFCECG